MTSFMTRIRLCHFSFSLKKSGRLPIASASSQWRTKQQKNKLLSSQVDTQKILTDNTQMNEMAHVWRRRYLTPKAKWKSCFSSRNVSESFFCSLVDAGVSVLRIFNLKYPIFRVRMVDRFKSLVRCVPNWIKLDESFTPQRLSFAYVYLPTVNKWMSLCLTHDTCRSI